MELRELKGDDLFKILPLIGKLDVRDELVNSFEQGTDGKKLTDEQLQARGMRIMATLIQKAITNLPKIHDDLNELLADVTGKSVDDIKALGMAEYTNLVIKLFKKPEFKEVFTSAVSLLKSTESTN